MTRLWIAAVVVGIVAAACSSDHSTNVTRRATVPASDATSTTGAPACNRPHPAGQFDQSFTFQGVQRTYVLYVPAAYDGRHAVPVVFEFHGFGSNAHEQVVYGDFRPFADRDGFLIVAPDGQGDDHTRHFDLTNDVRMTSALLDRLEQTLCVDPARVYSTGMSDGGAMTVAIACTLSDRFAAFGPVAVLFYAPGCGGSRPVPIVAFAGTNDPVVPFGGGRVNCCGGAQLKPASESMAGWASHDKCAPAPADTRIGTDVRKRTWSGCEADGDVAFYIVDGGGHTWPGAAIKIPRLGRTTGTVDASATIWDFFKAHARTG